ncbi:mitochondrial inner membrane protease ATP23-like isoform X1 [Salvia miltiorrhiza]|uniref:mitochondrial inner membrane protease ATP23-like isoform X1 n=1 Tax=Salvia miltiorrhiza TaxID=226208 RepID=UPI0025ACFE72|nr:mitochondrial inner membrane protease ATP23-like isoform X1 [Salvia miltiorrhiza]
MGDANLGSKPSPDAGGSPPPPISETMTVAECEDFIKESLRNPTVRFLKEHLEKSGCSIGTNFVRAVNCKERIAGRYVRGSGIDVCSNNLEFNDEVQQVIIHELIRAYDDCRANFDCNDCVHLTCSEIRANQLSGDCHYKRELLRGHVKSMKGHGQECVKRRTLQAVAGTPLCSKIAVKDAMEAVWDTCYNDTAPFDRAP